MDTERSEGRSQYIRAKTVKSEIMDLPMSSLYRLAATDPTMPVVRINGTVMFHRERLIKWLRAHEQGAANGGSR